MKHIKEPSDVPAGPHVALLVFRTVNVDTGYNDGGSRELAIEWWACDGTESDMAELTARVRRLETEPVYTRTPYVVLSVESKCEVRTEVVVNLGRPR
ncbi:MAG TPA: hypothetical protein VNI01_02060 [Elusimicrobiota bacterium]|jgi:hypothetical protein|nr:hypothetical protein [Elusimicrobiota bacterium]